MTGTINGRLRLEPSVEIHRPSAAQCADQQAAVTRMSFFAIDPRIRQSGLGWRSIAIFFVAWKLIDLLFSSRWVDPTIFIVRHDTRPKLFSDQFDLFHDLGLPYLAMIIACAMASGSGNSIHWRAWKLGFRKTSWRWCLLPLVVAVVLAFVYLILAWIFDPLAPPSWQAIGSIRLRAPPLTLSFARLVATLVLIVVGLSVTIYGVVLQALLNNLKPGWAFAIAVLLGFSIIGPGGHPPAIIALIVWGPLLSLAYWIFTRSGSLWPLLIGGVLGMPLMIVLADSANEFY